MRHLQCATSEGNNFSGPAISLRALWREYSRIPIQLHLSIKFSRLDFLRGRREFFPYCLLPKKRRRRSRKPAEHKKRFVPWLKLVSVQSDLSSTSSYSSARHHHHDKRITSGLWTDDEGESSLWCAVSGNEIKPSGGVVWGLYQYIIYLDTSKESLEYVTGD